MCAGVTVHNGIRKMNITPGEIVAIQGLGGLGHLAVQYASKMGYRTVALSRGTDKKDFALKLGATDYIDTSAENAAEALQKMGGAALIVATAPNPEHISPLVGGCKALGKLLILARKFRSLLVLSSRKSSSLTGHIFYLISWLVCSDSVCNCCTQPSETSPSTRSP